MPSGIAPLFIFLHQPSGHSAFCSGLWSLCKCDWRCNRYYPRVCPDCIASHIALIMSLVVSLWSYCCDGICARLYSLFSVSLLNHFYWPQGTSGLRRNSLHSWITHLHTIISQAPSAKPARLSRITSRPSTLPKVEVDIDIPRVRLCRVRLAILSPLIRSFSWWLFGKAWVHSSCFTTTHLEKRWSASSLLSMCSSISAWLLIETCKTFPKIASADWEGCIRVGARMKEGL